MQKYIYLGIAHRDLDAIYMHAKIRQVSFEEFKSSFTETLEIYWGKSFETCYNPIREDILLQITSFFSSNELTLKIKHI